MKSAYGVKFVIKLYKNINLNKIQLNDLMSQSHRTKSLSKGIKIVSKRKNSQICCIPLGRRGLAHGLFNSVR